MLEKSAGEIITGFSGKLSVVEGLIPSPARSGARIRAQVRKR
jgi:hypothetical protein